jgi:sec-independent protein translocase protein TatA
MPIHIGVPELLIILVVVVLLFGVGRIGKIAGELGSGIRAFKDGLKPDEKGKRVDGSLKDPQETKSS